MHNNSFEFILIVIFCIWVGFIIGAAVGNPSGQDRIRQEAVKAGVAKWVTTANEKGAPETKFEWIVPIEKKEIK